MNDKGKEVVSFIIDVSVTIPSDQDPGKEGGTASWRIEKAYNEVLGLDSAVKTKATRQESKLLAPLPDKNLFKDHSPHKSDQRKVCTVQCFVDLNMIADVFLLMVNVGYIGTLSPNTLDDAPERT